MFFIIKDENGNEITSSLKKFHKLNLMNGSSFLLIFKSKTKTIKKLKIFKKECKTFDGFRVHLIINNFMEYENNLEFKTIVFHNNETMMDAFDIMLDDASELNNELINIFEDIEVLHQQVKIMY